MTAASSRNAPTLIRYPRGSISEENFRTQSENNKTALIGYGASAKAMFEAKERAKLDVYLMNKLKPINVKELDEILRSHEKVCTLDECYMAGGLGEAVGTRISELNLKVKLLRFGVPDVCVKHATQAEQREEYGLTAENILRRINED